MRIIIDTIKELDELAEVWAAGRRALTRETTTELVVKMDASGFREAIDETLADLRGKLDDRPVTAEGAVIPPEPQDDQHPASADAGGAPAAAPAPEPAPKRKRRTKAEIAADEAAAKAAQAPAANPLDNLKPESDAEASAATVTTGLDPAIIALAATLDGNDRMAHMNEGRDFISKHGFPKYNETFALADVPPNIASHTPEQAALHRAAMQWLVAQGGAA